MHIKLRKSVDDEEKFDVPLVVAPSQINTKKWLSVLMISFLIFGSNIFLLGTPSPQFELTMKQGNNESEIILNTMRKSLKLISFFALDFNSEVSSDKMDTFDEGTQFEFSYNGYKKISPEYTRTTNGLDIFSCLIEDIGVQLSNITTSNSEDTERLISSFLTPYHKTINNFNNMYLEGKKTGNYSMNESFLSYGSSSYDIQQFGETMTKFPMVAVGVSVFTTTILMVLVAYVYFNSCSLRVIAIGSGVQAIQFLCFLASYGAQFRFYYKLNRMMVSLNLADLRIGTGYRYLQFVLILALMNQVILGFMFRKSLR